MPSLSEHTEKLAASMDQHDFAEEDPEEHFFDLPASPKEDQFFDAKSSPDNLPDLTKRSRTSSLNFPLPLDITFSQCDCPFAYQ